MRARPSTDWMEQEARARHHDYLGRGYDVRAGSSSRKHEGVVKLFARCQKMRVNIIDTPGHVDFTAEVERSLRVLDGAVFGILRLWQACSRNPRPYGVRPTKYGVPRIAFVNKMDRTGANFANAIVSDMRDQARSANAWPVLIPIGAEDLPRRASIDIINQQGGSFTAITTSSMGSTYTCAKTSMRRARKSSWHRLRYAEQLVDGALCNIDRRAGGRMFLNEKPKSIAGDDQGRRFAGTTIANKFVPVVPAARPSRTRACSILVDAVIDYPPVADRHPAAAKAINPDNLEDHQ